MKIFLEKRLSRIHEFGIFTKKKITKGEIFYRIPLDKIYYKPRPMCARIGEKKYVSDRKVLNWINHSCEPNSRLIIKGDVPMLIALHDIMPDTKITLDYSLTENKKISIDCKCGSKKCRGHFHIS